MGKHKKTGRILGMLGITALTIILLAGCSGSSYSGSSYSGRSSGTTRNGYDMPKSGENFSDYVKRVDPDLYKSMQDQYNTAVNNGW